MIRGMKRAGLALTLVTAAEPAAAHALVQGQSSFSGGALHLLTDPLSVVALAGAGLAVGLRRRHPFEEPFLALLAVALVAGALIGSGLDGAADRGWIGPATALSAGALIAAGIPLEGILGAGLVVALGLAQGILNAPSAPASYAAATGWAAAVAIVGTALAFYAHAFARVTAAAWMRIATRTVGSWIAAIGLLSLATRMLSP